MTPAAPVFLQFRMRNGDPRMYCHWQYTDAHGRNIRGAHAVDDVDAWRTAEMQWMPNCDGIVALSQPQMASVVARVPCLPVFVGSLKALAKYMPAGVGGHAIARVSEVRMCKALTALWHSRVPASTGGLRALTRGERLALLLPLVSSEAVASHPAAAALSIARDVPLVASQSFQAKIVRHMLDPRNYIDPLKPDRMACLRRHYSATPKTMRRLLATKELQPGPRELMLDTLGCLFAGRHWLSQPQALVELAPEDNVLLWSRVRDLQNRGGYDTIQELSQNPTKLYRWWLGGAQLYLRFVRDVWLDSDRPAPVIAQGQSAAPRMATRRLNAANRSRRLFVPAYYFTDPTALAVWHAHVAELAARTGEN